MPSIALPLLPVNEKVDTMNDGIPLHGDNFAIVIPVDQKQHTEERPFCDQSLNPDCLCREDQTAIQEINNYVQEGLLTPYEAERTWKGQQL